MKIVNVIGNGESRKGFDLKQLSGTVIGCNAIYRDFTPDILCASDQSMCKEIRESDYAGPLYTRPDWNKKFNALAYKELPWTGKQKYDDPWHMNTGPHAINIACKEDPDRIILLGFDISGSKDNPDKINNYYKDTENYDASSHRRIPPSHWHPQLNNFFRLHPDIEFVYVQPSNPDVHKEWRQNTNVIITDYQNIGKYT